MFKQSMMIITSALILTLSGIAFAQPHNIVMVWGEVHSNKKGSLYFKLDNAQPYYGHIENMQALVGSVIKVGCQPDCGLLQKNDLFSAKMTVTGSKQKPVYTIRKIKPAQNTGIFY